ncbi:MAG: glycine cleavage system protein GcvH [Candidatus Sumerlaeia bacterium]
MSTPSNCKFTKDHEWVRVEGDEAVIGISDFAQAELGDITFVETPSEGDEFGQGDAMATVESVKAASDIYAPVSGEVVAANDELEDAPELVNESPYDKGWIVRLKMSDSAELEKLMDAEAYDQYVEENRD